MQLHALSLDVLASVRGRHAESNTVRVRGLRQGCGRRLIASSGSGPGAAALQQRRTCAARAAGAAASAGTQQTNSDSGDDGATPANSGVDGARLGKLLAPLRLRKLCGLVQDFADSIFDEMWAIMEDTREQAGAPGAEQPRAGDGEGSDLPPLAEMLGELTRRDDCPAPDVLKKFQPAAQELAAHLPGHLPARLFAAAKELKLVPAFTPAELLTVGQAVRAAVAAEWAQSEKVGEGEMMQQIAALVVDAIERAAAAPPAEKQSKAPKAASGARKKKDDPPAIASLKLSFDVAPVIQRHRDPV